MNLEQLRTAVEAQKKAFALLLWIKERVQADSAFLGPKRDKIFAAGDACACWILRESSSFPRDLRIAQEEASRIGNVLASFFRTSVRIANVKRWHQDGVEIKLVTGAVKFTGRRNKRYAQRRQQEGAAELCRLAFEALAAEYNMTITESMFDEALALPEVAMDLSLWTYGRELIRRCEFASQGATVRLLWLALDDKTRKNLSAEIIWQARERLVQWLRSTATKKFKTDII